MQHHSTSPQNFMDPNNSMQLPQLQPQIVFQGNQRAVAHQNASVLVQPADAVLFNLPLSLLASQPFQPTCEGLTTNFAAQDGTFFPTVQTAPMTPTMQTAPMMTPVYLPAMQAPTMQMQQMQECQISNDAVYQNQLQNAHSRIRALECEVSEYQRDRQRMSTQLQEWAKNTEHERINVKPKNTRGGMTAEDSKQWLRGLESDKNQGLVEIFLNDLDSQISGVCGAARSLILTTQYHKSSKKNSNVLRKKRKQKAAQDEKDCVEPELANSGLRNVAVDYPPSRNMSSNLLITANTIERQHAV